MQKQKVKTRKNRNRNTQAGFLHLIGLFAVFAATLWYFQIDVRGFIDAHPEIQEFFVSWKNFFVSLWNNYLSRLLLFLWDAVLVDYVWKHGVALVAQARGWF